MTLSKALLDWYDLNCRTLPWRGTNDPYRIWLSEIMLQQTRTETVERYYHRFLERFPTVHDLAEAPQDEVLKLWEGLGYYSRARNLHAAAKFVAHEMNGIFPGNATALKKLPGVGPYAANAIASIAYSERVPALDGNQARVLSRIAAWDPPLRTPFDLLEFATELISHERPGDYNQALMDLGASVCTPKKPICAACPLNLHCAAYKEGDPESYPKKLPPTIKREEELTIVLVMCSGGLFIRRRPQKGLLAGMYEFASIEGHPGEVEAARQLETQGFSNVRIVRLLPPSKHVFTHLVWRMHGWLVEAASAPESYICVHSLQSYAIPSALRAYRAIAAELLGGG